MRSAEIRPNGASRPVKGPSLITTVLALVSLAFGTLNFVRLRSPHRERLLAPRVVAAALSPVWAVAGLIAGIAGAKARRPLIAAAGLTGALASATYVRRVAAVTPPAPGGPGLLRRSAPQVRRDLMYHVTTQPVACGGGERPLYCDLWQPAADASRTGISVVYLHGSAWYLGDKAQMTDPMLGGWASQGHVVMDVAYRMCPETDLRGMLADAWAAIVWLKTHADEYGIDPQKIVLAGTSAGGHIALLAAYAAHGAHLAAAGFAGQDVSVGGVIGISAPVDMAGMLEYHENLIDTARPAPGEAYDPLLDLDPVVPPGPGATRRERMDWQVAQRRRLTGLLRDLLGGGPDESPEMFAFATVKTHVRPGLPPTLLIQGDQDALVPVEPTRELSRRLQAAGVRAEYLELPLTDHAFELALPLISPPARAASVAIRRFLAEL